VLAALLAGAPGISSAQSISFEDVTSNAGFTYSGESWGASWGDYNGDGRPDIFTNNHRTFESVYRNNGDGTFTEVAAQIDVEGTWAKEGSSDTHGAAWADFDNDGDQDLMVANGFDGASGSAGYGWRFFVNQGGMLFDRTSQYGFSIIPGGKGGRFPGWIDVNKDGKLDLLTMNHRAYAQLYIQNASGGFDNTGSQLHSCRANHVMLISDIDADGRVEIVCPKKDAFPDKIFDSSTYPAPFINETSLVPFTSLVQDTVFADFNNDSRPDMFHVRGGKRISGATQIDGTSVEAQVIAQGSAEKTLSFVSTGVLSVDSSWETVKTTSQIYIGSRGNRPATFQFTLDPSDSNNWGIKPHNPGSSSDVGIYIGYDTGAQSWQFRLSPGGSWQLATFVVGSTSTVSNLVISKLEALDQPQKPALFMNTLAGFKQDLVAAGLNQAMSCVDAVTGDFDNDMDLDLFLVCREAVRNIPDRLFANQGKGSFVEIANAGGAAGPLGASIGDGAGTGETVVTADYDTDGYLDLFVTNGLNESNFRAGGPDKLFHNLGHGNHWIELDLRGTLSNRDGIGAKVFATTGGGTTTQLREQNGGYHRWAQNHSRIHFGLGSNTSVDLRIEWPSGAVDVFNATAADRLYRAEERGQLTIINPGGSPAPSPCCPPTYNKATERGLFIWKNCAAGTWQARMTAGGGSSIVYRGNAQSSQNFTSVTGYSIETNDTLNVSDPSNVVYALSVSGSGEDGFDFAFPASATVCFNATAPAGVPVYLGADRTLMTGPFNLGTIGPCN